MPRVEPLHAQCIFTVSRRGEFHQHLIYDYYDEEGYYARLLHKPRQYKEEMLRLAAAMQEELNQETVRINGVLAYPKVLAVSMEHRGSKQLPYIIWIIKFKGPLKRGVNIFENISEEEIAEYDYEVIWSFPTKTKILDVEVRGEHEILQGPTLMIWARKGTRVGGLERITFKL